MGKEALRGWEIRYEAHLGKKVRKRLGRRLDASTQGTAVDAGLIVALLNVLHFDAMHGGRC